MFKDTQELLFVSLPFEWSLLTSFKKIFVLHSKMAVKKNKNKRDSSIFEKTLSEPDDIREQFGEYSNRVILNKKYLHLL